MDYARIDAYIKKLAREDSQVTLVLEQDQHGDYQVHLVDRFSPGKTLMDTQGNLHMHASGSTIGEALSALDAKAR